MKNKFLSIPLLLSLMVFFFSLVVESRVLAFEADVSAPAATITVCASGCDYASIQDAIDAASSGDTIEIEAGIYLENLTIDEDITLQGADQASTIIDGQAQGTVVKIKPNNTVTIADVKITDGLGNNQGFGTDDGGGIFNEGSLTLLRTTISGNEADFNGSGGGIWNGGTLIISESSIKNNKALGEGDEGGEGGGIYNHTTGQITISHSAVDDNQAFITGGGITNFGTMDVSHSTVDNNDNGGISNEFSGTMTLNNSTVKDNQGTGIWNFNMLTLNDSTISGNMGSNAGGIWNDGGTLIVEKSTINDNSAISELFGEPTGDGGGILNFRGAVEIRNSTLSGNSANDQGGAIWSRKFNGVGSLTLENSTINNNSANEGGGIYDEDTATLSHTIVANSTSGADCAGTPISSLGYNLDSDDSCNLTESGDQPNSDPKLGPLQDNSGPTFTHHPFADSPVIDSGDSGPNCGPSAITTDQRGIARPQGAACDIGSVEMIQNVVCGGLVQEAENGTLNGYFEIGSDPIASSGQYIHVPEGMGNSWNGPNPAHKADYCFNVETNGLYQIKGSIYAESGRDNSFFVKVDGSPMNGHLWSFAKNTDYREDLVSDLNGEDPVQVVLSEGQHTIEIFLREDGGRLDQLELELVEAIPPPELVCDGLMQEAEDGQLKGAFVIGDDNQASGDQYIHVPNGAGNSFNMPDPLQKASYCFQVDEAGTYRIKGDVYAASGQDNSFFVQVDDAPASGYLWDVPRNTDYDSDYVSDRNGDDPVELDLSAGEHIVTIFLREDGARLDKLELELVTQRTPQGTNDDQPMIARGILGTLFVNDYQEEDTDASELDLSGINLTLVDAETGGETYNETTQTDHLGQYYFDEMPVGQYTLTLELPDGYSVSQDTQIEVTTDANEMVEESFDISVSKKSSWMIYLPLAIR